MWSQWLCFEWLWPISASPRLPYDPDRNHRRACAGTGAGHTGLSASHGLGGVLERVPTDEGGRLREPREACVRGYTFLPPEDRAVSGSRPAGPFRDLPPNAPHPSVLTRSARSLKVHV